uniref:Uncharacterized protein n=1 Tax=Anser cygnoides TaxID=8845 RepID=A0A8B9DH26_ANSCY
FERDGVRTARPEVGCWVPTRRGEEDLRDGGVPFFVNRGGLPVDEPTWERMWRHVARIHPEGERVAQRIRAKPCCYTAHRQSVPLSTRNSGEVCDPSSFVLCSYVAAPRTNLEP